MYARPHVTAAGSTRAPRGFDIDMLPEASNFATTTLRPVMRCHADRVNSLPQGRPAPENSLTKDVRSKSGCRCRIFCSLPCGVLRENCKNDVGQGGTCLCKGQDGFSQLLHVLAAALLVAGLQERLKGTLCLVERRHRK